MTASNVIECAVTHGVKQVARGRDRLLPTAEQPQKHLVHDVLSV